MKRRWMFLTTIAVLLIARGPFVVPARGQQGGTGSARSATLARMPWGDPDLQGVWNYSVDMPLERPAEFGSRAFLTDAEVVTLAVAQAIMGISSDARFIRTARKQLAHLFPLLQATPGSRLG